MHSSTFVVLLLTLICTLTTATPFLSSSALSVRGGHKSKHPPGAECPRWVKALGLHKEEKGEKKKGKEDKKKKK